MTDFEQPPSGDKDEKRAVFLRTLGESVMSVSLCNTKVHPAYIEMSRTMLTYPCEGCGHPINRPLPKRGFKPKLCEACVRLSHVDSNQRWGYKVSRDHEEAQRRDARNPESMDFREGTLRFGEKVEAAKLAARQSAPKHEEFTYEGCEVAE